MAEGRVLIVDDEQSIRRICSLYLKAEGLDVETLDGAEGLDEKLAQNAPDVIVLDLNMPGMDGFAATQHLKSTEKTSQIPILILSGRQDIEDKRNAMLNCGADDYLTKPFDPKELITRIEVLRNRHRQQLKTMASIHELEQRVESLQSSLAETMEKRSYFKDAMLELIDDTYLTPLKLITEMVDSIEAEDAHSSAKVEGLLQKTRQLQIILDKLMELKNYRSGKINPHFRYISIGNLLDNLLEHFTGKAKSAGIEFEFFSPNPEFQVLTDPDRVRRAIGLLLDRAIYITKTGKVEFDVSVDAKEMRITVSDNIPGDNDSLEVAEEERPVPLTDESMEKIKSRSILLKLPLARNIIEKINGKLVMSTFGSLGSRISIQLPLKT